MDTIVLAVFAAVDMGMMLGGIPWSALDRAGVALLGAIGLLAAHKISPESAWDAVNVPTIALLFGFMVVSAQLRLSGFYTRLGHRLAGLQVSPPMLLALLVGVIGVLSAVLANDIVCLAITPVLVGDAPAEALTRCRFCSDWHAQLMWDRPPRLLATLRTCSSDKRFTFPLRVICSSHTPRCLRG